MILTSPNPIAFYIYNLPIYWYGIILAIAIYIGMHISNNLFNRYYSLYHRKDIIYEYIPIIVILGLVFARLYYCCLNPTYYFSNPIETLNFRQGGLSIHGALIGGLIATFIISKKTKVSMLKLLAPSSCGMLLAQSIGRWGNFFNSEAYGIPTNQLWGLFIPSEKRISQYAQYQYFHPTFLYESILDFIGFIILYQFFSRQQNKNDGRTFFLYLMIYSTIRLLIEPLRIDSALRFGIISIVMPVSIVIFGIGLYFFKKNSKINI